MSDAPVIAIDGPGGSGKGTVSARVAQRLGYHLLDSGALYRLVALAAERHRVALDQEPALETLAAHLDVEFQATGEHTRVRLEGEEVSDELRTESCGAGASRVAAVAGVRAALLERQRAFRQAPGLVADGRDMGTVIFPDATLKIFLTASPEERARRRYKQLKEKGLDVSLASLSADIAERDRRDASRTVAPLVAAADAIECDTTGLTIEEVVDRIESLAKERGLR